MLVGPHHQMNGILHAHQYLHLVVQRRSKAMLPLVRRDDQSLQVNTKKL